MCEIIFLDWICNVNGNKIGNLVSFLFLIICIREFFVFVIFLIFKWYNVNLDILIFISWVRIDMWLVYSLVEFYLLIKIEENYVKCVYWDYMYDKK